MVFLPTSPTIDAPRSAELTHWVDELVQASRAYDGPEFRSARREPLVCFVEIYSQAREHHVDGFTRKISPGGVGVITSTACRPNTHGQLAIHRFDGTSMRVASLCLWSQPYGEQWYLSGWEFVAFEGIRRF